MPLIPPLVRSAATDIAGTTNVQYIWLLFPHNFFLNFWMYFFVMEYFDTIQNFSKLCEKSSRNVFLIVLKFNLK